MRKLKKSLALLCVCGLLVGAMTGCSNGDSKKENTGNEKTTTETTATPVPAQTDNTSGETADNTTELSGTIKMAGSTSMEKLANALAEDFMAKHEGVTVSPEFIGSGAGIEALLAGTVDIGNSSRSLKDSEKQSGAVENIVAIDGIAVIVDTANKVTDLTKDQLVGIYTGTIKNWSELGGDDMPIVVVGREAGSGTRGAFEEILEVEDKCAYANELDNTGAVMAKVASTKGAIGYVSLDILDSSVIAVALEGVAATPENIVAGNYFLSRPFVMATKGEVSEQSELIQAFYEYLKSDDGKAIIQSVGLILAD